MNNKFFILSVILASCFSFTAQANPKDKPNNSPKKAKQVVVVKQPQKTKTVIVKQPQHKTTVVVKKPVVIKPQPHYKVVPKKQVVVVKKKPVKHPKKPKHKANNTNVIIIK